MKSILKRASFWRKIIQAFQAGLSIIQGVTLYNEELVKDFNVWIAVAQAILAMVSILTQDENQNDEIDLIEDKVTTTVTVTAPKSADVTVDKTTETTNP